MTKREQVKEDFSNAVLLKICKEKIKAFDTKTCKAWLEILEILARAKVKSISDLIGIINEVRPEAMNGLLVEVQGSHHEQQSKTQT